MHLNEKSNGKVPAMNFEGMNEWHKKKVVYAEQELFSPFFVLIYVECSDFSVNLNTRIIIISIIVP